MDQLPSVWGQHSSALIEAVFVRGRLITSILDAPGDWGEKLTSIGFKRSSQAWLRIGPMTQSEFRFLSPEIKLVGMRAQHVIDLPNEHQDSSPVPLDVQDALLGLWQRQVAALLVALSMEHDAHYTRSQAWSFVEAALEGELTPETETLLGLTFTKMSKEGALSAEAYSFSQSLGWDGAPAKLDSTPGKTILSKGESVQWMDKDGVAVSGRLAQRLQEQDLGCWVYKSSPVWAGGYVVASPLWIKREQLDLADFENDRSVPDRIQNSGQPIDTEIPVAPDRDFSISIADVERKILGKLLSTQGTFPREGWKDLYSKLEVSDGGSKFERDSVGHVSDSLPWFIELERCLQHFSQHYYGSAPVQFVINGDSEEMDIVLSVSTGNNSEISGWYAESGKIEGEQIDVGRIVESLETERSSRELKLRASSAHLGQALGTDDIMWPVAAILNHRLTMWKAVTEYCGNQINADTIFMIQSVVSPQTDLMQTLSRHQITNVITKALSVDLLLSPENGMAQVKLDLIKLESAFSSVNDLAVALERSAYEQEWLGSLVRKTASLYKVRVDIQGSKSIPKLLSFDAACIYQSGVQVSNSIVPSMEQALTSYRDVLGVLKPLVDQVTANRVTELNSLTQRLPLIERFIESSARLHKLPRAKLEGFIEAELQKTLKDKTLGWRELTKEKIVSDIAKCLLSQDAQGVAVAINTRGASIRWSTHPLLITSQSVAQSRLAEIQGGLEDVAKARRWTGTLIGIDGISLTDPELCQIVNEPIEVLFSKPTSGKEGVYENTGFVAGFSAKDIRGYDSNELIDCSDQMNDHQKMKYLTKDLLWPRSSFEELKEQGFGLVVALAFDVLWKGLPKQAKSTSRLHVVTFIHLVTSVRKTVEAVMKEFLGRKIDNTSSAGFLVFAQAMGSAVTRACDNISDLRKVYGFRDEAIRGMAFLRWTSFDIATNSAFWQKSASLSWSDVLKTKKLAEPSLRQSRVQRDLVQRVGSDHRQGRSVTSEDFIRTFGFSGVEYGTWTNQKEREKHLNFAFDSMMDFAEALSWEPMLLSLGGKLGLCIGSRGTGGPRAANAHLEPANMAINLTRMRGDGALAHEYFHAVACHYGLIATGSFQDVTDTFAYGFKKPGALPAMPVSGMREDMRNAFYELMVSIMRQPGEDGDPKKIETYSELSEMLKASIAQEKPGADYLASPRELFARAMEIWVSDKLASDGRKNDYLVSPQKVEEPRTIYPDQEHLSRIKAFADLWIDKIRHDVRIVDHPFMGMIEMPVLNTEHKSIVPWSMSDIKDLAREKMDRLFRTYAPSIEVLTDPNRKAGMYDLAKDLITLNSSHADDGDFYHEAWHACHQKLLTHRERLALANLFSNTGVMSSLVTEAMYKAGFNEDAISHAISDTRELQAYAFQLWSKGQLRLVDVAEFYRVRGFIDGVDEIAGLFSASDAIRLFERFSAGELADRRMSADLVGRAADSEFVSGNDPQDWDSDNTIFWSVEEVQSQSQVGYRSGITMG
ncbi:LPD1 domain-containing protein [Pseudomonas cannabina]|nr:LPD1 domain-containing protein [Pseudomonas cannabina]